MRSVFFTGPFNPYLFSLDVENAPQQADPLTILSIIKAYHVA